jgi:hypothetical protein
METPSSISVKLQRISKAVWIILAALVIALVAIFIFKVAIGTVVSYGFFGLMMSSHFLMHGGHGSHGAQTGQDNSQIVGNAEPGQKESHAGHGGCH